MVAIPLPATAVRRALVIHPDAGVADLLLRPLAEAGYRVTAAAGAREGAHRALNEWPDVVFLAPWTADGEGAAFLRSQRTVDGAPVVILAGPADAGDAWALLREGAWDVLRVPFHRDDLALLLRRVDERERLRREIDALRAVASPLGGDEPIVAESRVMRDLVAAAGRLAGEDTPVLIVGEPGVGKSVLARMIHRMSPRRDGLFVPVACGGRAEGQIAMDLVGSPGARGRPRMSAAAERGTLYLRHLDELPPTLVPGLRHQATSPAAPGEGARWIASAAQVPPAFADLFGDRVLAVPPLRERGEEIPALVSAFLRDASDRLARPVSLTPDAMELLASETWPGNLRELRGVVERAAVLAGHRRLDRADVAAQLVRSAPASDAALPLSIAVDRVEREAILRALASARGNRREAAKLLGVSLRTLFYKLSRHRIG